MKEPVVTIHCGGCGVESTDVSRPCSTCRAFVFLARRVCHDCHATFMGRACAACFARSIGSGQKQINIVLKKTAEKNEHTFALEFVSALSRDGIESNHPNFAFYVDQAKSIMSLLSKLVTCGRPLADALNSSDENAVLTSFLANTYIEGFHFGKLKSDAEFVLQKATDLEAIGELHESIDLLEQFFPKCPGYTRILTLHQQLSTQRVPWDDDELRSRMASARAERRYQQVVTDLSLLLPSRSAELMRQEATVALGLAQRYVAEGQMYLKIGNPSEAAQAFSTALTHVTDCHEAKVGLASASVAKRNSRLQPTKIEDTVKRQSWFWRSSR